MITALAIAGAKRHNATYTTRKKKSKCGSGSATQGRDLIAKKPYDAVSLVPLVNFKRDHQTVLSQDSESEVRSCSSG